MHWQRRCSGSRPAYWYLSLWGCGTGTRGCRVALLTTSPEQTEADLDEALPPPFQALTSNQPIHSPTDVAHNPFDWYWNPGEEVWLDQTLEVLVDIGATACCVGLCRELDRFDIALGNRKPLVESFQTDGTWFYNQEGTPAEDGETAFSGVHKKQMAWGIWRRDVWPVDCRSAVSGSRRCLSFRTEID